MAELKTERYINDQGEFRCFGFPNTLIGKSGTHEVLSTISGLEFKYFSKNIFAEEFCEFVYKNRKFTVSEPYGDNSYYDILCEDPNTTELEEIYNVFKLVKLPTPNHKRRLLILILILVSIIGLTSYMVR